MPAAVTVVIPFKTDSAWLRTCLDHLERQTFRSFDVILVPDRSSEFGGSGVRVLPSGPVLPNEKRRLAAAATSAPIIALIDDDAYPAPEWLAAAMRHFADDGVVASGGPAVTPADDSERQRASGAVFAARIVTAGTRHRYVPEPLRDVAALPSCDLLMRRDAFLRASESATGFWPGEDLLLCRAATRDGKRIVYDPAALVYHHRRALFAGHLRQVWSYALFRGYFMRRVDHAWSTAAYLVPPAFALGHAAVVPLLSRRGARRFVFAVAAAYAALVAASAVPEARAARTNPLLVAAGIYLTHLAYGAGTTTGWLRARDRTG